MFSLDKIKDKRNKKNKINLLNEDITNKENLKEIIESRLDWIEKQDNKWKKVSSQFENAIIGKRYIETLLGPTYMMKINQEDYNDPAMALLHRKNDNNYKLIVESARNPKTKTIRSK